MSTIAICNRGLTTYLGESPITSLSDGSPAAVQCDLHYDALRKALLEAHWWVFATGRQTLAELTNDRTTEWLFRYQRPTSALALRWVNEPSAARAAKSMHVSPDTDREVTDGDIYSDTPAAVCEFTTDVTDATQFPQSFADALSAAVAAAVAMPLTQDYRRAERARDLAEGRLHNAIAMDSRNIPPEELALPVYLRDRGVS